MAPARTAALAAALFVGVSADADTRQPRLRGAAPAVEEASRPSDARTSTLDPEADLASIAANEQEFWGHVSHTGATWGRRGLFGPRGGHIGHTSATWGRPWMLDEVNQTSDKHGDKEVASSADNVSNETDSLWGHFSHTGATWGRRGWFGPRGGHIGHTSATWGRPWMLDEVNQTGDEPSDKASKSAVASSADNVSNDADSLWGHFSHTGATWGRRGWFGPRGGHIGHTSATWGRPWMLDQVNQKGDEPVDKENKSSSVVDETESFWAHVSHTGATWGRRGWFGPRGGHIGHTSATWGHPWMLNDVNQTVEAQQNLTDDFWVHVGHTGATWGRFGGVGHVGHTSATWGHPWMLDEKAATPNDTAAGNSSNTSTSEDVFPGSNDEFWLLVGPEGASVTKERPAVLSAVPATPGEDSAGANETELPGADDDQLEAFWAHVSHTGARWGRVGVWGPRYGHIGHTSATWGRPWR